MFHYMVLNARFPCNFFFKVSYFLRLIVVFYYTRAPISDRSEVNTCFAKIRSYESGATDLGLSEVTNTNLKNLLTSMLSINPKKRPGIGVVQIALNFCG